MKIAFFDFDGTITSKDSTIGFIRYFSGDLAFIIGIIILLPFLTLYKLRVITNNSIKKIIITYFFKGISINKFSKQAKKYSLENIDSIVRKKAYDKIQWHKDNGHTIVIVSASIDLWLQPWCEKNNIPCISSELEIIDQKITGNLLNNNCFGPEKVKRINNIYKLSDYEYIYAYGNSRGDFEMLNIANEKYYKPFT